VRQKASWIRGRGIARAVRLLRFATAVQERDAHHRDHPFGKFFLSKLELRFVQYFRGKSAIVSSAFSRYEKFFF
jgi:hypothetical protein